MRLISTDDLKRICPVKWHELIPEGGISLGVADIDFEGPQGIVDHLRSNIKDSYSFYQYKRGLPDTLDDVQTYLASINVVANHDNIQITPGTMMGIYAAMKLASRQEGKVIYAGPLYEPIHRHGKDTGNEFEFVDIHPIGLDVEQLKESVDSSTKMIAINNPSNPIGYVFGAEELELIRDLALDYDFTCFSDELYLPMIFSRSGKKHIALASIEGMGERTISLFGFSKAYGLAGYRAGFLYAGELITEEIQHIVQSQMVSPSPISSLVTSWALKSASSKLWVEQFTKTMAKTTQFAAKMFLDAGFQCEIPDSCFFIYPNIGIDDVEFSERVLKNQGVQVIPGRVFGPTGANHLRINCGTSEERLADGIKRIITELKGYEK